MNDFFFWASIITTILSVVFLCGNIWQLASSRKDSLISLKEKELHKAQVKIWQHFASGINYTIMHLADGIQGGKIKSLSTGDFGEILRGLQASSYSLFTSLNEERLFSEEEIKQRQLEREKQFEDLRKQSSVEK